MIQETVPAAAQGEEISHIWSGPLRFLTIGVVLVVSAAAFEALAIATVMPATARDLGGLELYGWAFSIFILTSLVGTTIAGSEADRHGPAWPLIGGVAFFTTGLLIGGLAPSMLILVGGRAIQGFGAGAISSVAYTAVGRGYPDALRARMLAVLSSAWVIPGLIGPALAGIVSEHIGWRWVFLGLAPLPPLAAVMTWPSLRRLTGSGAPRDWRRTVASIQLALGAGILMAGLGMHTLAPAIGLVLVGLLVGVPALRQVLPAGTLRAARGMPAAIGSSGLLNAAFFGVDAFIPLMLISAHGLSATTAGLALTAATLTWTTGAWVQAHLAGRGLRRSVALAGLGLIAIGIVGAILAINATMPLLLITIAWAVAGLGMGLAFSTGSLVMLEMAPAGEEGKASSGLQIANQLGMALGAGLGGVFVAYASATNANPGFAVGWQFALMLGVVALSALVALRMPARKETLPAPDV